MKRFRMKAYLVLTLLMGAFLLSGCGGNNGTNDAGPGAGVTLTAIAVTPATFSIPTDVSKQFTATGTYSDGSSVDLTASANWSSGDPLVTTMSVDGLATGIAAGPSVLTATVGTVSGSATLTVTAATLSSIAVTPVDPTIPLDLPTQFAATGTYSDGSVFDITALVTWASSNTLVATMSVDGLAIGITSGTSEITATIGITSPVSLLTVTAVTLNSIAVTPASPVIAKGQTQNFTATGTYSDATTVNITTAVEWLSGNPLVATMNPDGLATSGRATGIDAGAAVITATLGSTSANTTLTVTAPLLGNPLAPNLGEVDRFVILASQTITTTSGSAIVNGDLGILDQARSFYTGFTDGASAGQFTELTNGLSYAGDDATPPYVIPVPYASMVAFINQSRTDLGIAYSFLAADPNPNVATQVCPIELGGLTLTRGVYKTASDVTIMTGDLTLDAAGDPDSVFIFTIGGNLSTGAPGGDIVLIGGAQAKNVYWRTAGTTILGTDTIFSGNVFAWSQVNVLTNASVTGRLFGVTEQVTLESNNVTKAP